MRETIPDRATIARYRAQLDENTMQELFDAFHGQLAVCRYVARDGQMVDFSFALILIERNSRDENTTIKVGDSSAKWHDDAATAKLRQKDVDARWTQKRGKNVYGYKNYICVDVGHKFIHGYVTTPANNHDINVLEDPFDPEPTRSTAVYGRGVPFQGVGTRAEVQRQRLRFDSNQSAESPL